MSTKHKRGDTFDYSGQIDVSSAGSPVLDMTGWAGRSQVRTNAGVLIAELVFTWLDAAQRLARLKAADTTAWPVGHAMLDIQLTSPSGDVISTDTAPIYIAEDVTRD